MQLLQLGQPVTLVREPLTMRSAGGSALLSQSTNVGHATETAQWEQYVLTEDRKQEIKGSQRRSYDHKRDTVP